MGNDETGTVGNVEPRLLPGPRPVDRHLLETVEFLNEMGMVAPVKLTGWVNYIDRHRSIPIVFTDLPYKYHESLPHTYHTPEHMLAVANIALALSADYRYMSNGQRAAIVMAAMYHDHSHTLGKSPDHVNISLAIEEFLKSGIGQVDPEWQGLVVDLIQSTHYVHGVERYSNSELSDILMDADMLYMTVSKNTGDIFYRLCGETMSNNVSYTDMSTGYKKQLSFLTRVKFFTPKAQQFFGRDLSTSLQDIRNYITVKTGRSVDNE